MGTIKKINKLEKRLRKTKKSKWIGSEAVRKKQRKRLKKKIEKLEARLPLFSTFADDYCMRDWEAESKAKDEAEGW